MKRRKRRIMAILLVFAMLFTMVDPSIFGGAIAVQAEESPKAGFVSEDPADGEAYYTYNIVDPNILPTISLLCKNGSERYLKAHYVLYTDVVFGEDHHNNINIGTTKNPFQGSFDGQGHSITGLWSDGQVEVNSGLFGIIKDATIKNLVIKNADLRSNQCGGVLAAKAENSTIQNVTIIDSSCKIASLGAVVGLITTGGLYGGALVGYANNTKFYNCESRNTKVYVDTTGGVQALGGDGMYMGGLVGWMDNGSILEYSRVVGGEVSTEYYVAVGALAANNLYAGGLVGRIDGSDATAETKVLDCFSSADVNYEGECYVSVGAGLSGYAGGIAARISGSNYAMERCHYAGNIHGYLLNSILVLPIIAMKDYYLGGIAGNVEDSSKIHNCYFNWNNAVKGNQYPDGPKVPAISGESNTGDVTTIGETQYTNPNFFVSFDFEGNVDRTTENEIKDPHVNKWVINKDTKMPVHGNMVYAEIDFPGAGDITFAKTSIQEAQTTKLPEESTEEPKTSISQIAQTYSGMSEDLELTATVNEGYNFKGWSVIRDDQEIEITQYGTAEDGYKLVLSKDSENGYEYQDGDVYVARYTANVVFRNVDDTGNYQSRECTYQQVINPSRVELEHSNYIFLGWSQTKPIGELDKEQLTTDKIEKTGIIEDTITVTAPITLYPVFIAVGNYNVQVQMESAPLQEDGNRGRVGEEGTAVVKVDENGDLFITIEDVTFTEEEGYHFDGWYRLELNENKQMQTDENGKAKGELVSRSETYSLKNIDLSNNYRYEARYKYRVKTYVPVKYSTDGYLEYDETEGYIGDYYVSYGTNINDKNLKQIPDPNLNSKEVIFTYWNSKPLGGSNYVISWADLKVEALKKAPEIKITKPESIYAVLYWNPESSEDYYHSIIVSTDFPAGTAEMNVTDYYDSLLTSGENGNVSIDLQLNEGYNFKGIWQYFLPRYGFNPNWSIWASSDTLDCVGKTASWDSYKSPYFRGDTRILARVTANIVLHSDKEHPETTKTVTRKYNSRLFNYTNEDENYLKTEDWDADASKIADPIYKVTDDVVNPIGSEETPKDADMHKEGYKFLGWTDNAEIFNVEGDNYVTTNLSSVDAYILDDNTRVTEKMELYPVYVRYDINTFTNFSESTLDKPENPDYTVTDDGTVTLTLSPIPEDFDSEERYEFKGWRVESEDSSAEVNWDEDLNKYVLKADYSEKYDIYAEYSAIVSFKNANGADSDIDKEYEYGEEIGELPVAQLSVGTKTIIKPEEPVNNVDVFVGWKGLEINDNSLVASGKIDCLQTEVAKYTFVSEDKKVEGAINLWPVYTELSISLKSNIGDKSNATITISEGGVVTLSAPDLDGYVFAEWLLNGKTFTETDTYTLSPKELRSGEEYEFTAYYDPVVTYKIPALDEDGKWDDNYTDIKLSIPYGEKIGDGQYSVRATIAAMGALEKAGYIFGGWAEKDMTEEYTSTIEEPITLYPLTNQAKVSIHSNIDDTVATITINQENGTITFPTEPTELSESKDKLPQGISTSGNDSNVIASFIGYSLVEITKDEEKNEISRTSKALYKAGDSISVGDLITYNGTGNYRIYAVWSQIQNIPEASIYQNGDGSKKGLFTAAAVNTKILATAGLQDNDGAGYGRHVLYSKGSKYIIVNTDKVSWNNTLYKEYFDKDFVKDETWNIYASYLYNISTPMDEYEVCPYLSFSYENNRVSNFRDQNNPTYSLKEVAKKLSSLDKTVQQEYSWYKYIGLIESYAKYGETD